MLVPILDREQRVLELRHQGKTFREIGSILNISGNYAHDIHTRAIRKLHTYSVIRNNYPEFIKAADELDMDYRMLFRTYKILKRGLGSSMRKWKDIPEEEIAEIENCGVRTLAFIQIAKTK